VKIEGSEPITVLSDLIPESEITDLIESGVFTRGNSAELS